MKKDETQPHKAEIKLDFKNLPLLSKTAGANLPKPPPIILAGKDDELIKDMKLRREF